MSGPVCVDGSFSGHVDPLDRGLTLGDGVFNTLVAFHRKPFAGARHLDRLIGQAAAIGISVDPAVVRSGWDAVLAAADTEHTILRTTVTRGPGGRGLWPATTPRPTVIVSAAPWDASLVGRQIRLVTSSIPRNPASYASRLKTLNYIDNVLAAREAAEKGADDALFLSPSGHVACSTIANIFALSNSRLLTPPLSDGVQPGIMRALILEAAASTGLAPEEASLTAADLLAADGVFLTNSVRFLSPVAALDGSPLADPAPAVAALMAEIAAAVVQECGYDPRGRP